MHELREATRAHVVTGPQRAASWRRRLLVSQLQVSSVVAVSSARPAVTEPAVVGVSSAAGSRLGCGALVASGGWLVVVLSV